MATLLELYTIEGNVRTDEATATGDVLLAIQLFHKVRTAVLKAANTIFNTALPTDDTRGAALEQLAWAQKAVASPDGVAAVVFRVLLAANANADAATILAASDAAIEGAISPVLALLSKGSALRGA